MLKRKIIFSKLNSYPKYPLADAILKSSSGKLSFNSLSA